MIDTSNIDFVEKLVCVNRVTKVVKGGRNFGFAAMIVVGDKKSSVVREMVEKINNLRLNDSILTIINPDDDLPENHPAFGKTNVNQATTYICTGQTCSPPILDPEKIKQNLFE